MQSLPALVNPPRILMGTPKIVPITQECWSAHCSSGFSPTGLLKPCLIYPATCHGPVQSRAGGLWPHQAEDGPAEETGRGTAAAAALLRHLCSGMLQTPQRAGQEGDQGAQRERKDARTSPVAFHEPTAAGCKAAVASRFATGIAAQGKLEMQRGGWGWKFSMKRCCKGDARAGRPAS